jgi:hypothetical protein
LATQEIKIYVNGVEVASTLVPGSATLTSIADTHTPVRIGVAVHSSGNFANFWDGLIDEAGIYNRALTVSEIQSIYNAGSAGKCTNTPPPVCVNPPSGLVSWWPGDDNAIDIQSSNHGALQNGTTFAPGKVGQAFSFDGVNDIVRISSVAGIEVQQFTIDAWVFAESPGFRNDVLGGIIVSKDIGDTSIPPFVSWGLVGPGNTNKYHVDIGFTDGSLQFLPSTNSFPFNTFNHVAATWDGSTLKLYVNGQLEGTLHLGPKTVSYSGEALTIGDHNILPAQRAFDGLIDEVEFYNRALSGSEIQAIYNAGSAGHCKCVSPPTADAGADQTICPSASVQLGGNPTGSGGTGTFTYSWTPTNGLSDATDANPTATLNSTTTYTVTVTDANGCTATDEVTVPVQDNQPPVIGTITAPVNPDQVNTLINASASFTDLCDVNDHTAEWNWGDGNTSAGEVNQSSNTVSESYTYTAAGVYTVTLTVTDGAGNSDTEVFQFVVIYDPNAGYVTGGGWIESPPGAYPVNPSLTGKAHFGFVSRYQQGKSTPDGNTQFDFKMADLKFKSTSYDWLVVSGTYAKYKGSGTINGAGDYGFMLFARDGQLSGGGDVDRFRIKIWEKDANETVVYDNQMGDLIDGNATDAIESGSITINSDGASKANGQKNLRQKPFPSAINLNRITRIRLTRRRKLLSRCPKQEKQRCAFIRKPASLFAR